MQPKEQNDALDEMLKQAVSGEKAIFDAVAWKNKYKQRLISLAAFRQKRTSQLRRWTLMQFIATAAAVFVAAVFLYWPSGTAISPVSGVWAAMVEKGKSVNNVVITGIRCFTSTDQTKPLVRNVKVKKYWSLQLGYMEKVYDGNNLIWHSIINRPQKKILVLRPNNGEYIEMNLDSSNMSLMDSVSLEGVAKFFGSHNYRHIASKMINGICADGYEITNLMGLNIAPYRFLFDMDNGSIQVWIDPNSCLPIWVEGQFSVGRCIGTHQMSMHLEEVDDDFQYPSELDPNLFKIEIPDGYKSAGIPKDTLKYISIASASAKPVGLAMLAGIVLLVGRKVKKYLAKR
jgi:hypothetical protein